MDKGKDHIKSNKAHQRYLNDEMTSAERHAFEKRLLDDEFEQEALEGFSQLSEKDLRKDMDTLSKRLDERVKSKKQISFWGIAASISLLVGSVLVIYLLLNSPTDSEIAMEKSEQEDTQIKQKEDEPPYKAVTGEEPTKETSELENQIIADRQKKEQTAKENFATSTKSEQRSRVLTQENNERAISVSEASTDKTIENPVSKIAELEEVPPSELSFMDSEEAIEAPEEIGSSADNAQGMVRSSVPASDMKTEGIVARMDGLRTITGTIRATEDDAVVPGVNVNIKGSSVGTITDIDGKYSVEIPDDEDVTLVYSFIGLMTEEVKVNDEEVVDVKMETDLQELTEVVVTAKGKGKEQKPGAKPKPFLGSKVYNEYLQEELRYPELPEEQRISGTVKLRLTISENGLIEDIIILKSLGEIFDDEAIRLVSEGPGWLPAHKNDRPITNDVDVKIRFRPPR